MDEIVKLNSTETLVEILEEAREIVKRQKSDMNLHTAPVTKQQLEIIDKILNSPKQKQQLRERLGIKPTSYEELQRQLKLSKQTQKKWEK